VAREAAKQSGRAVVPAIVAPLELAAWLAARDPTGLLVCLWERETAPLAERLPAARPARATVVVDPRAGSPTRRWPRSKRQGPFSPGWARGC
jgi:16S rRNA U1498 N3-methylase RsmE